MQVITNYQSFIPMLDANKASSCKLPKFLTPILSPLTINEYGEIFKTDQNYVMASLDVADLFSSIPIEATIENCVNYLFFDKSKIHDLTKQDVYDLLSAAAKESLF